MCKTNYGEHFFPKKISKSALLIMTNT